MRLILATALWQRPALTRFFMSYWQGVAETLADRVQLVRWAVASEEDPHYEEHQKNADEFGFVMVSYSNAFLWKKWNALMYELRESYDWGNKENLGVMVMGSDDIATPQFVELGAMMLHYGCACVQPNGCLMFHPESGRMSHIEAFNGGAGRFFHRDVLLKSDFTLWQENTDFQSVDLYQQHIMREYGIETMPCTPDTPWVMMDIKSEWNMWDWDQFNPDVNIVTKWVNGPGVIDKHFSHAFEATNGNSNGLPRDGGRSLSVAPAGIGVNTDEVPAN